MQKEGLKKQVEMDIWNWSKSYAENLETSGKGTQEGLRLQGKVQRRPESGKGRQGDLKL